MSSGRPLSVMMFEMDPDQGCLIDLPHCRRGCPIICDAAAADDGHRVPQRSWHANWLRGRRRVGEWVGGWVGGQTLRMGGGDASRFFAQLDRYTRKPLDRSLHTTQDT